MSKPKDISYFEGKWWTKPDIWQNVGANVVSRPTEQQAISNIALQSKYIRNLSKWQLELTEQELLVYKIDRLINSTDFDIEYYKKKYKVYNKDLPIVKISKITGYSLEYTRKLLKNISSKIYLCDVIGIDINLNIDNKDSKKYTNVSNSKYLKQKKNKYYKSIGKYKKKIS